MIRNVSLPLFLLFSLTLLAQTDRHRLEFSAGANYTFRWIGEYPEILRSLEKYDDYEVPDFGYQAEAMYLRRLTPRLHLGIGLGYGERGFKSSYRDTLAFGTAHDGEGGFDSSRLVVTDIYQTFALDFVSVPVGIRYLLSEGEWSFTGGYDFVPSYNISRITSGRFTTVGVNNSGEPLNSDEGRGRFPTGEVHFFSRLSLGVGRDISPKATVFARGSVFYDHTNSFTGGARMHLYGGAIDLGFRRSW